MNNRQRAALRELEGVKQAFPAKVETLKTKLAAWGADNTGPGNDDAAFTHALLELGMERLLELPFADENAVEQIEDILRKAAGRRHRHLQRGD
jgi:hypothetical protein